MNRAWTYIISKQLDEQKLKSLENEGISFVKSWTAHEQQLHGSFEIFQNRIIIIKVNENIHEASGCSIDKLTRFIKQLETNYGVELMNRLLVAYKANGNIEVVHSSKIKELLQSGKINENTLIYNTAIANEQELENWAQPLKETWLNKYL